MAGPNTTLLDPTHGWQYSYDMTNGEQYQIIGKVVSDLSEAQRRLACLESKAQDAANQLEGAAQRLKKSETDLIPRTWSLLTGQEIDNLLREIDTTRAKITDLTNQKENLGV